MNAAGRLVCLGLGFGWPGATAVTAAETVPVLVQSAPGRFEIAALDAAAAHAVAAVGEELWRALAGPLELPAAFPSPVHVRIVPGAGEPPFAAQAEAGGVVSVRIHEAVLAERPAVRRALVRGLLLQVAVARHGTAALPPRWLEDGALGWAETRRDPAQLDALRYRTRAAAPPAVGALLRGEATADEAAWWFAFLQNESARDRGEWSALLRRTGAGEDAAAALAAAYPGRFADAAERELWWQTGWHALVRARVLPTLEAADSRAELAALVRFVAAPDGTDRTVTLRDMLARAGDPLAAAELHRRAAALRRLVPTLHPFYRNAGLALADAFAAGGGKAENVAARLAEFEADWRAATELEAATDAALDALERRAK